MRKFPLFLFLAPSLSLLASCGGGGGGSTITNHFSVASPANIPTGMPFNFTLKALDDSNQTVTSYSGTVHFTSTDPRAQLPADATLQSGTKIFSATLTTASGQTITATDKATSSIT